MAEGDVVDLYEYEAKRIFAEYGITVPPSVRVTKPAELRKVHFGYPLTLKCQVLSGGRGKAGGIQFAKDLKEGEALAEKLLAMTIKGSKTESILVEPKVSIAREMYMAVTLDRASGCPVFIAASEGGIEIESNENIITSIVQYPFQPFMGRELARRMGLEGALLNKVGDVAAKLFKCFEELDLDLAEINPLIITGGGEVLALDGKMTVNDDSLPRQKRFAGWAEKHMTDLPVRERQSKQLGLNLVELDGNIGIMCNGAGMTMATMDMVKNFGGQPGNFLDAGGGSDSEKTLAGLEIIHDNPNVKVILLNILGGITACDEVAIALVEFMKRHPQRKMIVRLRGNNQDIAEKMLAESGTKLYPDLEDAVKAAVAAAK
ncbi:MAG: acetate--CoA ligase family protein [Candidatus Obscuribacterales bacterium]|nr:acetate--CoA ligase family protein [Candidatus Obscuribacterales bacterium]